MNIKIRSAQMKQLEDEYIGHVEFEVEGHEKPYEITLYRKENKEEWGYSLHFLNESGPEDEIQAVDDYLDENDEVFQQLIEAAENGQGAR